MEQEGRQEDLLPNVRISVRELVEFILRSGDIDNRGRGMTADREAMQEGARLHRKIQGRMGVEYRAELPLSITLPGDGYTLTVEGRADGVIRRPDGSFCVDEIKTMYRDVRTLEEPYDLHLAQAKCYAHMLAVREGLETLAIQLTYAQLDTEEIRRFQSTHSAGELAAWFEALTGAYRKWAEHRLQWEKIRQASLRTLEFPFAWRKGQKKLAQDVYRTILRKKKLFLQAPTGTGKTISAIYPAVRAVGEGLADRIFYATAKTVARTVAEEAFALLRKNGMRLKSITITAKEKICPLDEMECNPDACPFAKGHFDRVNDAVFELITTEEEFGRETILRQAQKWQVCPFELSLDVSSWADAIICDYNYIFDPTARLKRFFGEGVRGEYLFLIDEAHNLVDRGREMFSATLYKEDFTALRGRVKAHSGKLSRALGRCNRWLLELKREGIASSQGQEEEETEGLVPGGGLRAEWDVRIHGNLGMFPLYLTNLCGLLEEFLEEPHDLELNQELLEFYFQVRSFLAVCDRLDESYIIYSELCADGRFLLRLFCVDVSGNLQECLDRGRSTVFFSATLLPVSYYKRLLSTQRDNYAICAESVFDRSNRLILTGTDISSRYGRRTLEEFQKMAAYVLHTVRACRGNYLVFFSSYRMLEEVAAQFQLLLEKEQEKIGFLLQKPGMNEAEKEEFLRQFETPHADGMAGFCVMGGVFGEGIDLKEERLIGALVVGTGLPQICCEREILKYFYDRRGEDGFFYAYLCPGMNRVLQSAGRVIRTDQDKGVILLLDDRFAWRQYRELFPPEWETPPLCTLATVEGQLAKFWEGCPAQVVP